MMEGRRLVWEKVGPEDAAFYVGVSVRTLDRYQAAGLITPTYTPGGHRRFSVADLKRLRDGGGKRNAKPRQTTTRKRKRR